ncbi:MAG: glycosyltransferase [Chloroflexi bacterium]|nr:MAG: glycosyltransferase [Chloroflexota bacterium]
MIIPRVLVLYEYSAVGLPHGSAYIRLLQPLTHPSISGRFYVTPSPVYYGQAAEIVVVDRCWRPDCTAQMAAALVADLRRNAAKLVYQIDDDLLALPGDDPAAQAKREIVATFLREADGVIVSTPALRARYAAHTARVVVVANALDERLLVQAEIALPAVTQRVVLGYMGTHTHDADLLLLLSALTELAHTTDTELELQIVGGLAKPETLARISQLPFPVTHLTPPAIEYPQFLPWFTGNVRWDIALAPLADTPFNRAKSDIKFLDYAALGAPGVYSDLPVYAATVRHGQTGLLAANDTASWVKAIRSLIEQPDLRRELAANARRYLYSERILAVRATAWADALEAIWRG